MDHLIAPRTTAHVNAKVALDEIKRAMGLAMPLNTVHGPRFLTADVTGSIDDDGVRIQSAHAAWAAAISGFRRTPGRNSHAGRPVPFDPGRGEIGTLFRVSARPAGTVKIGGTAALDASNDYRVNANLGARRGRSSGRDAH